MQGQKKSAPSTAEPNSNSAKPKAVSSAPLQGFVKAGEAPAAKEGKERAAKKAKKNTKDQENGAGEGEGEVDEERRKHEEEFLRMMRLNEEMHGDADRGTGLGLVK
mmetsp:Transcript_13591/g.32354  ORF Transcript_13591/g.32354 Transcript_13591/m.32354 type:complete len:106 (-) Transcript_13591:321-638(-)